MQEQSTKPTNIVPEPLRLVGTYVESTRHIETIPALDTHQLAWAAGFFDGEGSTYLGHHGKQRYPTPCADVSQIHAEVLHRFLEAVGGIGSVRVRPDKHESRRHQMWSYQTRNWRDTQTILTLLWPYLASQKREQAARVFRAFQTEITANVVIGRPNISALWTDSTCPLGHTDIYVRRSHGRGITSRRCRTCRKNGTQLSYHLR